MIFPPAASVLLSSPDTANAATATVVDPATIITTTSELVKNAAAINPYVQFETVDMVPNSYFDDQLSIYGFVERILDGDTIRVRHIPGYALGQKAPEPLQKRGIADETLKIRFYGVDCPEIAKNKNQITQPFGDEAKQFTSAAAFHKMVKITLLRRDRYGRAIAAVETLPAGGYLATGSGGAKDLTVELARAGLAELYEGGGAEYYVSRH